MRAGDGVNFWQNTTDCLVLFITKKYLCTKERAPASHLVGFHYFCHVLAHGLFSSVYFLHRLPWDVLFHLYTFYLSKWTVVLRVGTSFSLPSPGALSRWKYQLNSTSLKRKERSFNFIKNHTCFMDFMVDGTRNGKAFWPQACMQDLAMIQIWVSLVVRGLWKPRVWMKLPKKAHNVRQEWEVETVLNQYQLVAR